MLQPKQTKFRKMHKGRNRGLAQNGNTIDFGRFGLVAQTRGRITSRQILSLSTGNEKMASIAGAIQEGARAYLNRQYMTCLLYTSPSPRD